jgi:N-acetylmuramoyl-L-alanine amidase
MILETAIICLALNIYHEARGEMIPGQYAVANVTLNRAKGDSSEVCRIVTAKHQFSWTNKLLSKQGGQWVLKRQGYPKDEYAWLLAQRVAKTALKRPDMDFTGGATFYHATYVSPAWRSSVERTKKMGSHIFYRTR